MRLSEDDTPVEPRLSFALADEDDPIQRAAQFNGLGGEGARSCRVRNGCRPARKRLQMETFVHSTLSM